MRLPRSRKGVQEGIGWCHCLSYPCARKPHPQKGSLKFRYFSARGRFRMLSSPRMIVALKTFRTSDIIRRSLCYARLLRRWTSNNRSSHPHQQHRSVLLANAARPRGRPAKFVPLVSWSERKFVTRKYSPFTSDTKEINPSCSIITPCTDVFADRCRGASTASHYNSSRRPSGTPNSWSELWLSVSVCRQASLW